jgi:uncharacterized membrane protein
VTPRFAKPVVVPAALLLGTLLTIVLALVQAVQIPLGALPEDSLRLAAAPFSHFAHVLGGAAFAIIGPLQFGGVLAGRYGRLHRALGRVFVGAGAMLSLSGLALLWRFPGAYSPAISGGRLVGGLALGVALAVAVQAIRHRNLPRHRDWTIRAYAIGVGATAVTTVAFPIYLVTGRAPEGATFDAAFLGAWAACILLAEAVVRRSRRGPPWAPPAHPGVTRRAPGACVRAGRGGACAGGSRSA